ncbi:MAG: MraY family glycosyltransferase [Isosphaeraceae bacterium]|nr:MraY family glycosyltransferase [Isosphaeraceae bacterium]
MAIWLAMVLVLGTEAVILVVGRPWLPDAVGRHVDGLWFRAGELAVILALSTGALAVGILGDLAVGLGWRFRLGAQVLLAAILAASGVRVTLFGPFSAPLVGGLVTVLWVVLLTNAFVFLNNMDGLAAGIGLVAALLFAAAQVQVGSLFAPAVMFVLAGVLLGFLVFNRYPARLFLGDSGGNFLGFLLGAITVAGTYFRYGEHDSSYNVLAPLLVMAVPLYESASVFFVWWRERDAPAVLFDPQHFSYRLLQSGLTPPQAVRAILLVSLGAGLGTLLLHRVDAFGAATVVGQAVCSVGVVAVLEIAAVRRERAGQSQQPVHRPRVTALAPEDSC